jgi:hypothetical protein
MGMSGLGFDLFLLGIEEEAMEGPWILSCRQKEVRRRSGDFVTSSVEFAMLHDEIRGDPVTA